MKTDWLWIIERRIIKSFFLDLKNKKGSNKVSIIYYYFVEGAADFSMIAINLNDPFE